MAKLLYLYLRKFDTTHSVPAHTHPCWEIVYYKRATGHSDYAVSGQLAEKSLDIDFDADISNNKHLMTFSDNTFVIFPPNVSHNEVTNSSADIVCIGFEPEDDYEKAVEKLTFCANSDADFSVWKYIQTIEQEFTGKRLGYKEMLDCMTRELLIFLSRRTAEKTTDTGLDYIIRYLDEYFMENIDVDELVKMSGFSPSRFRLLFKQKVGISPKQYILNRRLDRIKSQLSDTAIPLSEIANENGFSDYYQFSAFFKGKTGVSPTEYRKRS